MKELYRRSHDVGNVSIQTDGTRYLLTVEGGGRVDSRSYDAKDIIAQIEQFKIPETVLQSGR